MPGTSATDGQTRDGAPADDCRGELICFGLLADIEALALAVSGGPDSIALMHFAASCAEAAPLEGVPFPRLAVATVDHGLRPGSRREAEQVAGCERLGSGSTPLFSPGRARSRCPASRSARATTATPLLVDGARRLGASHLATAHTLDDQAETLLFRMARGSGPAGLAGMRRATMRDGLHHVRPFLGVAKARLVAACRANDWAYADDPSNQDPRFARTRLRALLPALAAEGLDAKRFGVLARRLAEADEVVAAASPPRPSRTRAWIRTTRQLFARPD